MAYSGLIEFIASLEKNDELMRIKTFVDPILEITEVTDRVTKNGGKALLFENTGTGFPILINAFGSVSRMAMAIGRENLDDVALEIETIFNDISDNRGSIFKKFSSLPALYRLGGYFPTRIKGRGTCQQVKHMDPDIGLLPVLKCWPYDGGRFITLPMVHTVHPETGKPNVGMYRMQVLDKNTTAMHWQRHKTGANHFEAWKKTNKKMPVSVALGGDPVYTYSATAPLPENIDEYILAGFLRKKKVKMVKCLTNDLYVPFDADIILEGYVDPAEELVWEGPFGDHTGFYSLADWYPKFHITCITHSNDAVYPATIVGIPPQEDALLARTTEKIFLAPVRMTILPEIEDFHMPDAGIAHNLVIVKINKAYPGQGMKVISSLFGAGQMMFTKYMIVVNGDIDIRNYEDMMVHVFANVDFRTDLLFSRGPLDVLDHSSEKYSFGGKLGIDATVKHPEEGKGDNYKANNILALNYSDNHFDKNIIKGLNLSLFKKGIPLLIVTVNTPEDSDVIKKVINLFKTTDPGGIYKLILAVDNTVDSDDLFMVAWQLLGNSDPQRDHEYISPSSILIDGTIKAFRKGGFSRKWPNVVCSDNKTISAVDEKWKLLGIGPFINSPSIKSMGLCHEGTDEIIIHEV
ncbi:MAG TPA: menaquinone biosynthesis decarboxylase [Bacteroidales bacterium]|nr:menaquinone biosynthesis decarboxylase [Bacteroidales bacterium]